MSVVGAAPTTDPGMTAGGPAATAGRYGRSSANAPPLAATPPASWGTAAAVAGRLPAGSRTSTVPRPGKCRPLCGLCSPRVFGGRASPCRTPRGHLAARLRRESCRGPAGSRGPSTARFQSTPNKSADTNAEASESVVGSAAPFHLPSSMARWLPEASGPSSGSCTARVATGPCKGLSGTSPAMAATARSLQPPLCPCHRRRTHSTLAAACPCRIRPQARHPGPHRRCHLLYQPLIGTTALAHHVQSYKKIFSCTSPAGSTRTFSSYRTCSSRSFLWSLSVVADAAGSAHIGEMDPDATSPVIAAATAASAGATGVAAALASPAAVHVPAAASERSAARAAAVAAVAALAAVAAGSVAVGALAAARACTAAGSAGTAAREIAGRGTAESCAAVAGARGRSPHELACSVAAAGRPLGASRTRRIPAAAQGARCPTRGSSGAGR
mmetsp:Transcript_29704/g.85450  ORF Transcript_29704/g.85450 Transcript_29704/m.85450 type:complete len:442 (+) Transcript_29704:517-1842(+)